MQSGHGPIRSVNGTWSDTRYRTLHGLMDFGQLRVHSRLILHALLHNLLSPDVFSGVNMVKNALAVVALSRTLLRDLTAFPRPPIWIKGKGGNRKKAEGEGRRRDRRRVAPARRSASVCTDKMKLFTWSQSEAIIEQEAQLMLTNPRDAFSGQSRSQNIVPFDMMSMVSYDCAIVILSIRRAVFEILDL